jgi:hypothetical protein
MISAMMVAMQPRTRKPSPLFVFLPLAAAFAIIAAIAIYGVVNPSKAKPHPNAPGFRGSLVWGDGIFSNKAQLKAWLRLHGASYADWVKQHPAALKLVKPPVKHKAAVAHRPSTKPPVTRTTPTTLPPPPATGESTSNQVVVWLAVIAGLLFGVLALLPNRIIRRARFLRRVGERELRVGALGAGAAVLLGVIVATIAG